MKVIIGNYKKRLNLKDTLKTIKGIDKYNNVIILPDSNYIKDISVKNIKIGVQDPFINENVLDMVDYIMIGHPDYKEINKETPDVINKFLKDTSSENIIILNVSSIDELKECLKDIKYFKNLYVSLEIVKYIGTTNILDIKEINKFAEEARKLTNNEALILYGGGVKVSNMNDLKKTSVDGLLVGSASLNNDEFTKIIDRWMEE